MPGHEFAVVLVTQANGLAHTRRAGPVLVYAVAATEVFYLCEPIRRDIDRQAGNTYVTHIHARNPLLRGREWPPTVR